MGDLWRVIAELSVELSPARVEGLAHYIGGLESVTEMGEARDSAGPNLGPRMWKHFLEALHENNDVEPAAVAAALRSGSHVGQLMDGGQQVSLAWTGPKTNYVPVRSTEQVMLEVIQGACKRLFLVSFVNVGARTILTALNAAADRGVDIRMLLEDAKGAAASMRKAVPAATIYVWNEESKQEIGSPPTASVHAKCVVSDGREAFVTSANLTDYALEKNIELGVHIVGGREPRLLQEHLKALVSTNRIQIYT